MHIPFQRWVVAYLVDVRGYKAPGLRVRKAGGVVSDIDELLGAMNRLIYTITVSFDLATKYEILDIGNMLGQAIFAKKNELLDCACSMHGFAPHCFTQPRLTCFLHWAISPNIDNTGRRNKLCVRERNEI
jgi:hypothetical protein